MTSDTMYPVFVLDFILKPILVTKIDVVIFFLGKNLYLFVQKTPSINYAFMHVFFVQ